MLGWGGEVGERVHVGEWEWKCGWVNEWMDGLEAMQVNEFEKLYMQKITQKRDFVKTDMC